MKSENNFLFLAHWANTIEAFDEMGQPDVAGELAKQIIYYGTKGEITTDNPIIKGIVNGMCTALIDKSKTRYANSIENGKKGGRPTKYDVNQMIKLRADGLSDQEIADNLGCSVQTVIKKLSTLNENDDEI